MVVCPAPHEVHECTIVGHGRNTAELRVAQPVRHVHAPVTVVVGTGSRSTHEHGHVTLSTDRHLGSRHALSPSSAGVGLQPAGVTVDVKTGHPPPAPPLPLLVVVVLRVVVGVLLLDRVLVGRLVVVIAVVVVAGHAVRVASS